MANQKGPGLPGAVRSAETRIPNGGPPGPALCPCETERGGVGETGVQGGGWAPQPGPAGEEEGLSAGSLRLLGRLWAAL